MARYYSTLVLMMFLSVHYSVRLLRNSRAVLRRGLASTASEGGGDGFLQQLATSDLLMTGLSGPQTISVKVVNCREVVQEAMLRNDLSKDPSTVLAEVMACALMMGSGFKGEETLQVNIVGTAGMRNCLAITDGDLKVRGQVGDTRFKLLGADGITKTRELFGEVGQVQVVRNHPSWKAPQVGIVALRPDASIPINLALYMTESEQRSAVMITDIKIDGNLCRHALGVCVERLPGCSDEDVELSIRNLEEVERKGLSSFLARTEAERSADKGEFRNFEVVLDKIMDHCLEGMNNELRWSKAPQFRCSCDIERVWRAFRLLPKSDVEEILADPVNLEFVSSTCEFCGQTYKLSPSEIREKILSV